jgi:hypothetical protein
MGRSSGIKPAGAPGEANCGHRIAVWDTTGRANPDHVSTPFQAAVEQFPRVSAWAFHGHDTHGLGAANVLAAGNAGVRVFDASIAGLGGCPFAPGATGNVATEDLAWMFEAMGIATGIDLAALVDTARRVAQLPGAHTHPPSLGGAVRWLRTGYPWNDQPRRPASHRQPQGQRQAAGKIRSSRCSMEMGTALGSMSQPHCTGGDILGERRRLNQFLKDILDCHRQ